MQAAHNYIRQTFMPVKTKFIETFGIHAGKRLF